MVRARRSLNPRHWNLFGETITDLRIRLPYYWSDWTDGINYRVVPASVFIFFANLLPAIAFAQDMFDRTKSAYGLNEVLMGSALGGVVFGIFSGQPLVIVGVTGPICIFNYTVFEIVEPKGIPFFPFITWVCIWAFIMHVLITMFNGVRYMKSISLFSCDIFASFINVIYIEKGIQILTRQFHVQNGGPMALAGAYFSIVTALCVLIFGLVFLGLGEYSPFFNRYVRKFISDYSLPLIVVFFTGFTFFPGRISDLDILRLPTGIAFRPTTSHYARDHGWFIHFWEISVGDVFLAIPFALLLTALFYFDHNISSIMSQGPDYIFDKPSAFHWDYFVLGFTTLVAGFLGIPPPNGLIPQAPLHTASLGIGTPTPGHPSKVVEQRLSNFTQGMMTVGFMTGPLLKVLGLVPQGVLAGLFFMMGVPGLFESTIIKRIYKLVTDPALRDQSDPLYRLPLKKWLLYMAISLVGVGAEVGISQTIAAVGFPGVLLIFLVIDVYLRKFFPEEELSVLSGPAASDFVLEALDRSCSTPEKGTKDMPPTGPSDDSQTSSKTSNLDV